MIERIHRGLAGFIWQLLIVAVVVLAVYVSAARVMLELLPSYRSALNDVLSEQIGTRIEIGELSAELIGFTPQLILQDLALQLPGPAENSNGGRQRYSEYRYVALAFGASATLGWSIARGHEG